MTCVVNLFYFLTPPKVHKTPPCGQRHLASSRVVTHQVLGPLPCSVLILSESSSSLMASSTTCVLMIPVYADASLDLSPRTPAHASTSPHLLLQPSQNEHTSLPGRSFLMDLPHPILPRFLSPSHLYTFYSSAQPRIPPST